MDFITMEQTRKDLQREFALISGRIKEDPRAAKLEEKKDSINQHYAWFLLPILQFFRLH